MSKLYEFRQNNSGGDFVFDAARGLSTYVYVEAATADEANAKAEAIGLYFDGAGDCPCCGDRWYEASEHSASDDHPLTRSAVEASLRWAPIWWMGDNPEGFVHYSDGRVVAVLGPGS